MKRGVIGIVLIGFVLLSITFASAFSFSEWWNGLFNKNVQMSPQGKIVNLNDFQLENHISEGYISIVCITNDSTNSVEPWIGRDEPFPNKGFEIDWSRTRVNADGTLIAVFKYFVNTNLSGSYHIGCWMDNMRSDTDLSKTEPYPAVGSIIKVISFNQSGQICTPGEKRCSGNTIENCVSNGTRWIPYQICSPDSQICLNGNCAMNPNPNSLSNYSHGTMTVNGCIDNEPQKSLNVWGNVSVAGQGTYFDTCADVNHASEFSCYNSTTVLIETIPCNSGEKCSKGFCSGCLDSDANARHLDGKNLDIVGNASNSSVVVEDGCYNSTALREGYCSGNNAVFDISNCRNGYICSNASCVPVPRICNPRDRKCSDSGNSVEACSIYGTEWTSVVDCSGDTPICSGGSCVSQPIIPPELTCSDCGKGLLSFCTNSTCKGISSSCRFSSRIFGIGDCVDPNYVICSSNSDCGVDHLLSEPFCVDNKAYKYYVKNKCVNAGTKKAQCQVSYQQQRASGINCKNLPGVQATCMDGCHYDSSWVYFSSGNCSDLDNPNNAYPTFASLKEDSFNKSTATSDINGPITDSCISYGVEGCTSQGGCVREAICYSRLLNERNMSVSYDFKVSTNSGFDSTAHVRYSRNEYFNGLLTDARLVGCDKGCNDGACVR